MNDLTFMLCSIVLCAFVLGAIATVVIIYNNIDPIYIAIGFFGGGVFGLAISTGVIGFAKIHESEEAEKEEWAQQKIADQTIKDIEERAAIIREQSKREFKEQLMVEKIKQLGLTKSLESWQKVQSNADETTKKAQP